MNGSVGEMHTFPEGMLLMRFKKKKRKDNGRYDPHFYEAFLGSVVPFVLLFFGVQNTQYTF